MSLAQVVQTYRWKVFASILAMPPISCFCLFGWIGERIAVKLSTDVFRGRHGEGIALEKNKNRRRALQKPRHEIWKPRCAAPVAQSSKPHLPIQSGLMWRDDARSVIQIPGLVFEFVGMPFLLVVATFHLNFKPGSSHDSEETVAVEQVISLGGFEQTLNKRGHRHAMKEVADA